MTVGRKRYRLARTLGLTGVWLAVALTLIAWLGVFVTLTPARLALQQAEAQLGTLDHQLEGAQAALAPFDLLSRPETLSAVQTLGQLAQGAQRTPLVGLLLDPAALNSAVTLTRDWEVTLKDRPPLPALTDARGTVQGWQARLHTWQRHLTWLGLGFGLLFTLLGAWFAAGQVALYRAAERHLRAT